MYNNGMEKGTLYIVSTPIGNLEDITLRALRVLKEVDFIAAEDTRHTLKLLSHYGISKPLISYWGEKEKAKAGETLEKLSAGKSVALVSDAGTPGISDPGAVLIRRSIDEGVNIVPIPGPSALISALTLSGFSTEEFTFAGFLPPKESQRRKVLDELSLEKRTLVLYEAPHRILECLSDISEIFGNRQTAVIKELTKMHEDVTRGYLSEVLAQLENSTIAGEYIIVLEGRHKGEAFDSGTALKEVRDLMKKGIRRKEAVTRVAHDYGISKKELYDASLSGE